MSRVFALVAFGVFLLGAVVTLGVAEDEAEPNSDMEAVAETFDVLLEPATVIPLVLVAGLMFAALMVMAR